MIQQFDSCNPVYPIQVTRKQRDNALYARDVMWPSIKPENVSRRLMEWRCGAAACFGGWVAMYPFFKAQGIFPSCEGAPLLAAKSDRVDGQYFLFGIDTIFGPRNGIMDGLVFGDKRVKEDITDHQLVTRRLDWLIEKSIVVEA